MRGYRALLVGAGGMGRAWGKNLRDCGRVELAGWVDLRPNAAAEAAEELKLSVGYTGQELGAALAELRPDFVVDVTVPAAHHDVTIAALQAGCHVLGEKPMADSLDRARAMVAAAEQTGRLYMVSQSRRYNGHLHAFRSLITQLGELGVLNADFYLGPHFGGFREQMAHPLLLDMAIHTFDAARYLSAADPVAVYCEAFNPAWSWFDGAACANALFELSGGLRFTYRASWCSEGLPMSWEAEWRAVGRCGSATWSGASAPQAAIVSGTEGFFRPANLRSEALDETMPIGIAGSLRDFLHALDTGATPMGECHDNIQSLAMVFAAIESAESGRRVPVAV